MQQQDLTRNAAILLVMLLSACTWTPKDEAWKVSIETQAPKGAPGNCLPAAKALRDMYGGEIAIVSHPDREIHHAVLVLQDNRVLDNGTVGYSAKWDKIAKEGWRFEYWWRL